MKKNGDKKQGKIGHVLGGDMLESQFVLRQIPLLLVILVFCLVMVAVRYRVESLSKEKETLQKQVSYLHEQQVQMQKQYQESIRISRIDRILDTVKVGLGGGPPYEIVISK